MIEHRYILEPYKGLNTRYRCPSCNKGKTFSLYIDTETREHIHPSVGRCNRETNCGYHYTPKQYFQDNSILFDTTQPKPYNRVKPVIIQQKQPSFINVEVFKDSLKNFEDNHFIKYLIKLVGVEFTRKQIESYFIGSSKHWEGATVFWQIDITGKLRTGKIMLYNASTGKRIKKPFNHITWVHSALELPEFELRQCFFGEHLLKDITKPVALVESEKTAIIAGVYLPQFIWLAVGSLTNLNAEKCQVLKGRSVTLFPDLNGFEKWNNKAKELSNIAWFTVSDLLECKATEVEKQQGLDLADYLVKFDYSEFTTFKPESLQDVHYQVVKAELKRMPLEQSQVNHPNQEHWQTWEQEIKELEQYFNSCLLPTQPVKLNLYITITSPSIFITSHLATVKANNGKRTFLPYLQRLQEFKQYLTLTLN